MKTKRKLNFVLWSPEVYDKRLKLFRPILTSKQNHTMSIKKDTYVERLENPPGKNLIVFKDTYNARVIALHIC